LDKNKDAETSPIISTNHLMSGNNDGHVTGDTYDDYYYYLTN